MVEIELYGLPRLYAGAERCAVAAGSLAEVLGALARALPGLVPAIVDERGRLSEHARVAIDGRRMIEDPREAIADGAVLVVISAQAGG